MRFVLNFSDIAAPLHDLTKKNAKFIWTDQCNNAFNTLKNKLTSTPILSYPNDEDLFILDTDASERSVGAVLAQVQNGQERVLAYFSKSMTSSERNYCVTRKELLAVIKAVDHFRQYLLGHEFVVRTDHSSLQWLLNFKTPEGQLARWMEKLSEYNFKIEFRKGTQHANADALSRVPCRRPSCPCHLIPRETANKHTQCTLSISDGVNFEDHPVESPVTRAINIAPEWSFESLREAQLKDSNIGPVLKLKEVLSEKPSFSLLSHQSETVKAYWAEWNNLFLENGVLLRKSLSNNLDIEYHQAVMPKSLREEILKLYHESPSGGHLGVDKTLDKIRKKYYWYNMKQDILLWCQTCTLCAQTRRPQKTPRSHLQTVRVGYPMERIAMDIMGPFQETERGNEYILVVQDYFSKWLAAYAIPNQEAETVACKVIEEWIPIHGAPRELHSDQGANFESKIFKELCKMFQIEKTRTTPYRPQSDGMVEKANSTIQEMLTKLTIENYLEWDTLLPLTTMAYNSSKHAATGFSPYMLLHGHEMVLPADISCGIPLATTHIENHPSFILNLKDRLEKVHEVVREKLDQANVRAKTQYDKHAKQFGYKIGDPVWLLIQRKSKGRGQNKLKPRYEGPFFIVAVISDVVFAIQKSPVSKPKTVHHDKLKPCISREPLDNSWVRKKLKPAPKEIVEFGLDDLFEDSEKPVAVIESKRPKRARKSPTRFGDWIRGLIREHIQDK